MALTKDYHRTFVPSSPGQPAREAQTVCTQVAPPGTGSGSGQYEYRCSTVRLPVGMAMPVSMGSAVTVLSIADGYVTYQICGSVWVPNG